MPRARIIGTGHDLPKKILTNFDLEKLMDTTDAWIRQRTGIHQRHIVADDEAASDLAARAAMAALDDAGLKPTDIDYILCATTTPDQVFPSTAALVQEKIGARSVGASDINAACSGFVYALEMGDALIRAGVYKNILVIGAETFSRLLNWDKRDTAILFGDGAGAVVLQAHDGEEGILTTHTQSDGSGAELLHVPAGGMRVPITPENVLEVNQNIVMNGQGLYKRAVFAFGEAIEAAITNADVKPEDIALFIPHQANQRIIDSAAQRIGMPPEKVYMNLDKVANTSAASIPIALDQAVKAGRVQAGDLILFAAFGAGLTWGSAIVRW
jgi:3-oxoacyl-[acyl-carrier-protein] synthase-3